MADLVDVQMYTVDDVRRRLGGASRSYVYGLVRTGRLRAIRVGRLPRITAGALREYLRSIGVKEADLTDGAARPSTPEESAPRTVK